LGSRRSRSGAARGGALSGPPRQVLRQCGRDRRWRWCRRSAGVAPRGLGVAGGPSVHGQCVRSVRARGHRTSSRTLSAASTTPRESITTPQTRPTISAAPGRLRLEQSQHSRPEELRTEAVRTASYGGTDLARPPRTQGAALTILVTGATGTVGRALVHALSERGQSVRALSRDPSTAVLPTGAEVVQGDLTDPSSLTAALDGVSAVHLIGFDAPRGAGGGDALTTAPAVVEAA